MKKLKVKCVCNKTKHDFKIEEIYENDKYIGDLFKCNHCGEEHLCEQNKSFKIANCYHTNEFFINCQPLNK